jgi:glyoxylase-like metal-dependent hydrolase (beta-lactamase superfamily II)
VTDFTPVVGQPYALRDDLAVVLAPNPSPMTYLGTNTFILGQKVLAVIDPGPASDQHLQALMRAIDGRPVTHILITHSHLDHSPLARALSDQTDAPICAFGNSQAGRSDIMQRLVSDGLTGGGEGIDHDFVPDVHLADGAVISATWGTITALHTPGHMGNHLCFRWKDAVFCGDHVMGWASSLVSPPDGDLTDFMTSCTKLRAEDAQFFYPAHGGPIDAPMDRLKWLITHRKARESQIFQSLRDGPATAEGLAAAIYTETPIALQPAAARNVFAHLVDLYQRDLVTTDEPLNAQARFALLDA